MKFLAGIYRALRHIVANLRWEPDRVLAANSNGNTSGIAERSKQAIAFLIGQLCKD